MNKNQRKRADQLLRYVGAMSRERPGNDRRSGPARVKKRARSMNPTMLVSMLDDDAGEIDIAADKTQEKATESP